VTPDARRRLDAITSLFRALGYPLTVTSTDRTNAQQDALYRAGKTGLPGGASLHNYGRAADVVPASRGLTPAQISPAVAYVARLIDCEPLLESDHIHIEFPL